MILRLAFLSLFTSVFHTSILSAGTEIDSLSRLLQTEKRDTVVIKLLNRLASAQGQAGRMDEAFENSKKAVRLAESQTDKKWRANAYHSLGFLYDLRSEFAPAIDHYMKALRIHEERKDDSNTMQELNNIGVVYMVQGNHMEALEYLNRALDLAIRTRNTMGIAYSLGNIGSAQAELKQYDKALENFNKLLDIFRQQRDTAMMVQALANIGTLYSAQGKYDAAMSYYEQALVIHEKAGDERMIATDLTNVGVCLFKKGEPSKALEVFKRSLNISTRIQLRDNQSAVYNWLAQVKASQGDFRAAYDYKQMEAALEDTLREEVVTKQMAEMSARYEAEKKDKEIKILNQDKALKETEVQKQRAEAAKSETQRNGFIGGFVLMLLLGMVSYRGYRQKKKANLQLEEKNNLIEKQKALVEEKNKDITDSINYAKKIQEAILPRHDLLKELFPDSFVLFMPRDVVSGDFYWFAEKDGRKLVAAVDCTGHGVPGAFMSMIGNAFLNEVVIEKGITRPDLVLNELRNLVISSLKQSGNINENKDGMDIALLCFDERSGTVEFAGANNPAWVIREKNIIELKPDKRHIGYFKGQGLPFSCQSIALQKGDRLYLFSDGYPDQFGGPKGKKFKYRQMQELLITLSTKPVSEQGQLLAGTITAWRGKLEQIDDILVIGIGV